MYTPGDDVRRRRCATTTTTKRGRDRISGGADCCCKVDEISPRIRRMEQACKQQRNADRGSGHPVTDGARRGEAIERRGPCVRGRSNRIGSRPKRKRTCISLLRTTFILHLRRKRDSSSAERMNAAIMPRPREMDPPRVRAPTQGASPAQGGTGTGEEVAGRRRRRTG
jgi:hypothetical protein